MDARAAALVAPGVAAGAGQALAASGAVGMAAALDEELNLKEQVG